MHCGELSSSTRHRAKAVRVPQVFLCSLNHIRVPTILGAILATTGIGTCTLRTAAWFVHACTDGTSTRYLLVHVHVGGSHTRV